MTEFVQDGLDTATKIELVAHELTILQCGHVSVGQDHMVEPI